RRRPRPRRRHRPVAFAAGGFEGRGSVAGLAPHPFRTPAATRGMSDTMSTLMHQAEKPRGVLGVAMGWLLENGNAVQNRATVDALDPPPGAAVLEIGFGPGHA